MQLTIKWTGSEVGKMKYLELIALAQSRGCKTDYYKELGKPAVLTITNCNEATYEVIYRLLSGYDVKMEIK